MASKPSSHTHSSASVEYCCGSSLMAHGPEALHQDYASRVERALGSSLPQMEVRVRGLSLTAQLTVSPNASATHEIPTVISPFKKLFAKKAARQQIDKPILHNFNAVFAPGSMTLVLGQPGSGKSSLLQMLGGRFPLSKTVTVEGDVTYNGLSRDEMGSRLPQFVSYVGQRDVHFPMLTVKETLAFAHECCGAELTARDEQHFTRGSPEDNKAALEAARSMYRHYPEVVTRQLGLEVCENTIVGDAMTRGISGGERKRVTTGEMDFGSKYVALMDEISTGLDSAATFDIVRTQRSIAQKLRKTVVMALLQPAPEVFALFDNVILLHQGYVVYSGPREQVVPYFETLGFVCPPSREVAEFLLDLGTPKQDRYVQARSSAGLLPRSGRDFAEVFETSPQYAATLQQLETEPAQDLRDAVDTHFATMPEFHQSFLASARTLLARELKVTWRNKAVLKGRVAVLVVIAIIYALLFYKFDPKNPQVVIGTLFPTLLFFALIQSAQIPRFMDARNVFYKQRGANFFRTSSYVLAAALNQVPLAFVESLIFCSIIYFLCGFVTNVAAFIFFVLVVFVTNIAFVAWFFLVAAVCPNKHVAEPLGMLSILLFCLYAGFVITHHDIPAYFVWIYWLNPVSWAMRSLAINQYGNHIFDTCVYDGIDYCKLFGGKHMGAYSLGTYDFYSDEVWLLIGLLALVGSFMLYMALAGVALEKLRHSGVTHSATLNDEDLDGIRVSTISSDMGGITPVPSPVVTPTGGAYKIAKSPRDITMDVLDDDPAPFTPVTLAFEDLWYSVPNPQNNKEDLVLLKGVSGYAKPGTITALMGSTGAGKTTLMDVIAGRKTGGKIQGAVLLNGHPATDLAIRRATGYCEQMDLHSEGSTFREALTFSAFLRQGAEVSDIQKHDTVEEVLDMLDLRPIADKIVRGSSVEQMKRLTIGVEMAAQPSVLFLDEPTSGLDARAAKLIMDGVRKVADSGRTVVCTIHQPSSEVFQVFDSMLLLKRGGEMVYFGELGRHARTMVSYFESVPGVTPLPKRYNPATWMLEVIGAGVGNSAGKDTDFVAHFKQSAKKADLDRHLNQEGVARPSPAVPELSFSSKRASSELTQAKFLIQRFMRLYWRTPAYNRSRFIVMIVISLMFGLSFRQLDYGTYRGINSGVGMLFLTVMFTGVICFKSVKPMMFEDRNAFYRERAAQTYNALWYFIGASVAEIPYVFSSILIFSAIIFPMVGLSGFVRFVQFWIHTSMNVLLQCYLGQLLAFSLSTLEFSGTIGSTVVAITFLFMGYNPPAELIPVGFKWLHAITPPKYTLAIVSSAVFGNCDDASDIGCKRLLDTPPTLPRGLSIEQYIGVVFHAKYSEIYANFAAVVGFIVLARVAGLLALRFVNHQKR